jgi:5,5'-dehydrodivanillate O-demethylase oxygenase subunit
MAVSTDTRSGIPAPADDYTDFIHTGPGTLAGRYLRLFWQPIYRSEDLAPGDAVPVRLLSEDFTLYRGEGGTPHLVEMRCAHRRTQLSTGWVEDDCIRCRYHGWRYDETGQCVEQPGEDPSFAQRIRIRSYAVQEYIGLIFAYIGDGEPPPMRRYPEFETEPCLEVYAPDVWPCNYFNRLDNFCDLGHVTFTHRESIRRRGQADMDARIPRSVETDYGIYSTAPGTTSFVDMPNINHLGRGRGTGDRLFWRVPIDDEHCVSYCVQRTHLAGADVEAYRARRVEAQLQSLEKTTEVGDAVLAGRARIEQLNTQTILSGSGYTDIFWTEDYVMQVGQGPVADRTTEHLGRIDSGVVLFRKLWERELKALAEGRPLKAWTSSAGLGDVMAE